MYSGYAIAFDGAGSWNFGNDFAWNIVIFGVDNSLSIHADNRTNNFSDEGLTYYINGNFGASEKMFIINFRNANTKFCLSLHYNVDNDYLFVNGKKFKANNENVNFPTQFCLESISNGLGSTESSEISLKGIVYPFQSITMLLINLIY